MGKLDFQSIAQTIPLPKPKDNTLYNYGQGFKQHFQSAIESKSHKLTVSKHAQTRMDQRHINIDESTWTKIESQLQQARKMGVTDSLVVTEQAALVISAKNNTVITAMGREEASSQIFTNINGTILIE